MSDNGLINRAVRRAQECRAGMRLHVSSDADAQLIEDLIASGQRSCEIAIELFEAVELARNYPAEPHVAIALTKAANHYIDNLQEKS